jgi:ABC-type branched-subunit amino acid transport system ATPase component
MTPILEVDHVTKRFGGVVAVDEATLGAQRGSITAVIGPNGAGKTTLFNVVTGFDPADAGEVRFEGQRVDRLSPWQVARRGLTRSFQTPAGFPALSVWENLMVAGTGTREESLLRGLLGGWEHDETETNGRARALLNDLALWDHRDVPLQDLSPGDVKLVDFARQLMLRPKMMLLDEPASGVDPQSIGRLGELILRLRSQGMTTLIIDHNIGFVLGIADQVIVMAVGKVIAQGTPSEVVEDERVIEIYLGRKT